MSWQVVNSSPVSLLNLSFSVMSGFGVLLSMYLGCLYFKEFAGFVIYLFDYCPIVCLILIC